MGAVLAFILQSLQQVPSALRKPIEAHVLSGEANAIEDPTGVVAYQGQESNASVELPAGEILRCGCRSITCSRYAEYAVGLFDNCIK